MELNTTTTPNPLEANQKIFSWNTAYMIISDYSPRRAFALLKEEKENQYKIYEDGVYLNKNIHLVSFWATPCLLIEDFIVECWEWR